MATLSQLSDLIPNRTFKKWSQSKAKLIIRITKETGMTEAEINECFEAPTAPVLLLEYKPRGNKTKAPITPDVIYVAPAKPAPAKPAPVKMVSAPAKPAPAKPGPVKTFGGKLSPYIVSKLMETNTEGKGLSYSEIARCVQDNFPGAQTSGKTVSWYVGAIKNGKYRGEMAGNLPALRERSKKI